MSWRAVSTKKAISVSIVIGALACDSAPVGPAQEVRLVSATPEGLEQTITVSPAEPKQGETIAIASVVVNLSEEPRTVTARICGLNLSGDLAVRLPPAVLRCAGYSQTVRLLPRDSLREFEVLVVGSEAGNYTLAVQHLLDPEHVVTAEVTVRD